MNIIDFHHEFPNLSPRILSCYVHQFHVESYSARIEDAVRFIGWKYSLEEMCIFQCQSQTSFYYVYLDEKPDTLLSKLKRLGNLKAFI